MVITVFFSQYTIFRQEILMVITYSFVASSLSSSPTVTYQETQPWPSSCGEAYVGAFLNRQLHGIDPVIPF